MSQISEATRQEIRKLAIPFLSADIAAQAGFPNLQGLLNFVNGHSNPPDHVLRRLAERMSLKIKEPAQ